ncbi:MAG: OmpA family protein [Cytophagales bacterium]|nr:OmpA family protein [Cytophagales bacterium]
MRKVVFVIITLSLLTSCMNKASRYYKKGYSKYKDQEYEFAIQDFKKALELETISVAEANFYIAECYRLSNRIHLAEPYYKTALENDIDDERAKFYYAFALKVNEKYDSTTQQLKEYLKVGENFGYKDRARKELKNLEELKKIEAFDPKYVVENCEGINTPVMEYSPVLHQGKLYYTSAKGTAPIFAGQGTKYTDMFTFSFDGNPHYTGESVPMPPFINHEDAHEASITFAPNGKYMVFARSNHKDLKDEITKVVDLYESRFVNGQWTEPKRLDICESLAWDSNPWISPSGKTLYFSSNRDGGFGGDDIWKATFDKYDSTWTDVVNLGKTINTAGNEFFPYVRKDGRFFFSSDGHVGFGGLDVFEYKKDPKTKKRTVKNLGKPINTSFDDFSIFFETDTTGYFTSNRIGGKGDDDIYHFGYTYRPKYLLVGKIKEEEKDILSGPSEIVLLTQKGEEIRRVETDSLGNYELQLDAEQEYLVKYVSNGYITKEESFSTIGKGLPEEELRDRETDITFTKNTDLVRVKEDLIIEFPPIYYDYNKWDIKPQAAEILDQMVKVMEDNPTILVELGSHTDNQGSMKYNDILSQKRAEKAVEYIISKGIPTERITAKGYGERKPLVMRKDTLGFTKGLELNDVYIDGLKEESVRQTAFQLNRRTEFKIVGFIGKAVDPKDIKVIQNNEKEGIIEKKKIEKQEYIIKKHLKKDE